MDVVHHHPQSRDSLLQQTQRQETLHAATRKIRQLKGLMDRLDAISSENKSLRKLMAGLDPDNLPTHPGPYARALQACSYEKELALGRRVHELIVKAGLDTNLILANHTVRMYGCCGSVREAHRTFMGMLSWNSVSWNALISAYAQAGHTTSCYQVFWRMQQDGTRVDHVTFILLLGVYKGRQGLIEGRRLHSCIREFGLESDVVIATALLTMYSQCHSPYDARRTFNRMTVRNTVSWTAMVTAYAQHGHTKEAVEIFHGMQQEGVTADDVTYVAILTACNDLRAGKLIHACLAEAGYEAGVQVGNALVNMYGKCRRLDLAKEVFNRMSERNVVSWTVIITAHAQQGQDKQGLLLFLQMQQEGIKPDSVLLLCMLDVCGNTTSLSEGRMVHACSVETGVEIQGSFGNAVVSMYGKCGSLLEAEEAFHKLSKQDRVSWTALITAYAQHGDSSRALDLFKEMKLAGVDSDTITYVSLLSVCSHAGLVRQGCEVFYSMVRDDEVVPELEHCGCIVGLLGRTGWLKEAEEFIKRMEHVVSADGGVWISLLGACGLHGDVERGKRASGRIRDLNPGDASSYIGLSNIIFAGNEEEEGLLKEQTAP